MKVIGLTGGIGAGKSTVSDYLLDKGFTVIDADKIARSMTEKGSETLQALTEAFGEDILFTDGCLDRKKLAAIVFSDEKKRLVLEELTTKKVVQIIEEKITGLQEEGYEAPVFIDAPLLFESGADKLCDAVWLVDASIDIRIRRVMARDDVTSEEVKRRILNQMSSSEKIARSTDIIDNSKGKEALYEQVERLLERYAETK
ncbi:dephospho-CoA kinase [Anaerovoracaceae bacterium 41-7]|jgi:dephospho-CoA kinase|uniref:Dephospho-CoA kinase n=1 Tax=Anaerotruncus colihominis TaxID=169435 RepID=A0A845QKF3_9FIRM|nr:MULTISPECIES: dephospho-CoA kinase [Clostridia]MCI9476474.1 dephospho-CoA kinase [Emergencia sp.]MCI9639310.1 dephospho-CoA kinase [Emergencia sp.]NBH62349.1 dephospho-CoA kinase [Anaerotruncus colihominis]NCE99002.1 dephospho-CoA kinase [Emergencia sp. 1XD21-10]NCF03004.1 dephospho-CoA kinase [Anaerotruncus sp. 80]